MTSNDGARCSASFTIFVPLKIVLTKSFHSQCLTEEELENENRLSARLLKRLAEKVSYLSSQSTDGEMKHKALQVENSHQDWFENIYENNLKNMYLCMLFLT